MNALVEAIRTVAPCWQYAHNARWGDGNGHSHVRAALLGPSLTVPFVDGQLTLGTWQQIVFLDFDNRPRQRRLVVQFHILALSISLQTHPKAQIPPSQML